MLESQHPADALGDHWSGAARLPDGEVEALSRLLVRDREGRVGSRWHVIVSRHPEGSRLSPAELPDLAEVAALLEGDLVLADTETTGLDPFLGDRVTSVGLQEGRVADGLFVWTAPGYERKVNPGRPSSAAALAVHGMGDAELAGKPPFRSIAGEVASRIDGRVVVAHNAPFDVDFLDQEFARTAIEGVTASAARILDTRILCKMLWPGEPGGLDALAMRLGIDRGTRDLGHGALADARLLGRCLPGIAQAIALRLGNDPGEARGIPMR